MDEKVKYDVIRCRIDIDGVKIIDRETKSLKGLKSAFNDAEEKLF